MIFVVLHGRFFVCLLVESVIMRVMPIGLSLTDIGEIEC